MTHAMVFDRQSAVGTIGQVTSHDLTATDNYLNLLASKFLETLNVAIA